VTFWWGLLLFAFSNIHTPLYVVIGAISITLLFLFISIPMIENKMLSSRPAFKDYQKRVSMLLLLPNKKLEEKPEKN
jgi:steroid 5-alpha reductase family enzyme